MPNLRRTAGVISSTDVSAKPLVIAVLILATIVYGCVFLWQPVGQDLTGNDGEAMSRGRYILVSLLYPEIRIATWFDSGRLPRSFSDRIPIAFGSLVWLALGAIIGIPLVRPVYFHITTWSARTEQLSMAILVGLALLSTATLTVGLMGGLKSEWPLCAAIVTVAIVVYGLPRLAMHPDLNDQEPEPNLSLSTNEPKTVSIDRLFFMAIVMLTCCAAAIIMLGAWLPPSEFDVLEYHLQAPKEFFQQGSISFIPHNVYANMPLGIEMHSLAMMTLIGQEDGWLGGLIGKSITASFSLVGAALLGAFLARQIGAFVGWCAAGLWLTSPGIAQVAVCGLIDGALATYILASAVAISGGLKTLRDRNSAMVLDQDRSLTSRQRLLTYWRLAGVTAGAAAAAKYPGLILAVLPVCAFFVWTAWRYRSVFQKREVILVAICIALEFAATCGPWYGKNWALAGNPVYPLAARVFGGKTLTPAKIAQWNRAHENDLTSTKEANGTNPISVNMASTVLSDATRLLLTSPFVQPAMILGILFCALATFPFRYDHRIRLVTAWVIWSGWIVLVWWFATHRIDRFWLPLTGLWAGLGAIGFWWLYQNVSPWFSHSLIVFGLGYGCVINSSPVLADNRYFVSIAALRVDTGDENQVPKIFPTTAWVNQNLDNRKTKILLIGEARAFEFLARVEYSTCFDINPGEVYLRGRSGAEQRTILRQRGITHILVLWAEIHRYRSPKNYGFSDWPQPSDIQKLVDDGSASRVDWEFSGSLAELLEVN